MQKRYYKKRSGPVTPEESTEQFQKISLDKQKELLAHKHIIITDGEQNIVDPNEEVAPFQNLAV